MKYLSDYMKDKQTELFEELGVIFAFSNQQFEEQKKEGVIYTSLGSGVILPKGNSKKFIQGLKDIAKEAMKEDVKDNGATKIISREFHNYETGYTGDEERVREALNDYSKLFPDMFSDEVLKTEFAKCYEEAKDFD